MEGMAAKFRQIKPPSDVYQAPFPPLTASANRPASAPPPLQSPWSPLAPGSHDSAIVTPYVSPQTGQVGLWILAIVDLLVIFFHFLF